MDLRGIPESTNEFLGVDRIVATHPLGNDGISSAHEDGTVVAIDCGNVNWVWSNPGKRVSCVSTFDQLAFVAFEDGNCCLYSRLTGLKVASAKLELVVERISVFEHYLVCWNAHQSNIVLSYRFNLEPFYEVAADSFVVNVFSIAGRLSVVCAADIYWLITDKTDDSYEFRLELLLHLTNSFVVDAVEFEKKWCLVSADTWCLMSLHEDGHSLETEIEVNAPMKSLLKCLHQGLDSVVIESAHGHFVHLKGNNIQLLETPFLSECVVFSVYGSIFVNSDLEAYHLDVTKGEFDWVPYRLPIRSTREKYSIGESDPNVTAVKDDLRGFSDGSSNGTVIFTSPVVKFDKSHAYSTNEMITLPLQPVNIITPTEHASQDSRVTIRPIEVDPTNLSYTYSGIEASHEGYVNLQRFHNEKHYSSYVAVYLILLKSQDFDKILENTNLDPTGITVLEDMAVYAREYGHTDMLHVIAKFLTIAWTSERIQSLLQSTNARSLKVLAAVLQFMDVDQNAFVELVQRQIGSKSTSICDAILWIFESKLNAFKNSQSPFTCINHVTSRRLDRFAEIMVENNSAKLITDISSALVAGNLSQTDAKNDGTAVQIASCACELLAASISLGSKTSFPSSEAQLVEIVQMILPAIRSRIPGAKDISVKLLMTRKILYHKEQQRLLVPTLANKEFAGLVFDMKHADGDDYRIKQPSAGKICDINFTGDGKSIVGVSPTFKVIWSLNKGFHGLLGFGATKDIEASEFQ